MIYYLLRLVVCCVVLTLPNQDLRIFSSKQINMFLLKLIVILLFVAMVVCYPVEKKVESDKVRKQETVVEQGTAGGKKNERQQGSESVHYPIPTILFGYHPFPYYMSHYFPHAYGSFGANPSSYYGSGLAGYGNSAGYGHANSGSGFSGSGAGFGYGFGGSNHGTVGSGYGSDGSNHGSYGSSGLGYGHGHGGHGGSWF